MKNICQHCGDEFEFPIPKKFCMDKDCDFQSKLQSKAPRQGKCEFCGHTWTLKGSRVTYCPNCRERPQANSHLDRPKATCIQCGGSWTPRKPLEEIRQCPLCKRQDWMIGRVLMQIPSQLVGEVQRLVEVYNQTLEPVPLKEKAVSLILPQPVLEETSVLDIPAPLPISIQIPPQIPKEAEEEIFTSPRSLPILIEEDLLQIGEEGKPEFEEVDLEEALKFLEKEEV